MVLVLLLAGATVGWWGRMAPARVALRRAIGSPFTAAILLTAELIYLARPTDACDLVVSLALLVLLLVSVGFGTVSRRSSA